MKKKNISAILPADLLAEAGKLSASNQTETIVLALQELIRSHKRRSIAGLKGKCKIDFSDAM